MLRRVVLGILLLSLPACAKTVQKGEVKTIVVRETVNELQQERVPGTEDDVWVEGMYDQVCVPGRIDTRNVYYRKGNCQFYEIRPGKYQKVQYPDFNGQYPSPR